VGGHIVGNSEEETLLGNGFARRAARHLYYAKLVDRLAYLVNPVPHDPWPRHSDHTGASLAVRCRVYSAVGGMPPMPFREDLAFVERVCRAGYLLRHPLDVRVTVSARLDGRAAGGMSDCLKRWVAAEHEGLPHLVEDPRAIVVRLLDRRFDDTKTNSVCLSVGDDYVQLGADDSADGAGAGAGGKSVEIEFAISQLQRMIAKKERETNVRERATLDFLQRVD
jgi:hypothetical protein